MHAMGRRASQTDVLDWQEEIRNLEIESSREQVKESQNKQERPLPILEIGLDAHIVDLKKRSSGMSARGLEKCLLPLGPSP
jgi:hypothetical protein